MPLVAIVSLAIVTGGKSDIPLQLSPSWRGCVTHFSIVKKKKKVYNVSVVTSIGRYLYNLYLHRSLIFVDTWAMLLFQQKRELCR